MNLVSWLDNRTYRFSGAQTTHSPEVMVVPRSLIVAGRLHGGRGIPSTGGWVATGPTSETVTIESSLEGGTLHGTLEDSSFTNVCTATADFGTKGFWHNKNGLALITLADIAHVNGLAPYDDPTTYFDDGDEPFDGMFEDGTLVAAAHGSWGDLVAPEGSAKAEISQFLVDPNAGADPREQLAQQLLAFIFNTRHALDSPDAGVTGS